MNIRMSIRTKLLAAGLGTIFISGGIIVSVAATTLYQKLHSRLELRGFTIANLLAAEVVDHVLTEKFAVLELLLRERLRDEQDIAYAFVTNQNGAILAHTFEAGFPTDLKGVNPIQTGQARTVKELQTEEGMIHDIAVPLLKGEIGSLHIGVSLAGITKETTEMLPPVISIIVFTIVLSALVFSLVSYLITRPVAKLAKTAEIVGNGNLDARFDSFTNDEIGDLGRTFNNMIEMRKKAEEERIQLILDLQSALNEIKTLSGLLPMCSWCKKIRDDNGYWKQVEVYITEHSDAEFTHGICPECMKQVRPNIAGKGSKSDTK